MKRRLFAVAAFYVLTLGVYAQTPLPLPPTGLAAFPSATQLPTQSLATATPVMTVTASETLSPRETIDPLAPVEPLDIAVTADVLFPAGIAFQVIFREPQNGISSISLTAEQDGWEEQTIEIDLTDVSKNEDGYSGLRYLWSIDENPPRLFEPMTVTWSITPRNGVRQSVETELVFADSRVTWNVVEASGRPARFAIAQAGPTGAVVNAKVASLTELLDAGGRNIPPLNVVVFPSGTDADPCRSDMIVGTQTGMEAPCEPEAAAALYSEQGWDTATLTIASPVGTIVSERIIRAVYPSLFASPDVPEWFKTGLIAYLAGSFNVNELEIARSASRSNSLLPSLDIVPSVAEINQWRIQSVGMVVYMASQSGIVPMLEMLNRIDNGDSLGDALLEQSGLAINTLNAAWRNWIFTFRAEAAYSMPPSLAPTVTLAPTRTASFTPTPTSTFTPSATWTNTLVPSITPTWTPSIASGFQQPTAAPTATPTATPRPTITPRPPLEFSLNETPVEPESPLNRAFTIIAVGAVITVVITGASLLWNRRRK